MDSKKHFFFFVFSKNFGWGALPPRPPGFWLGGQSPPRPPLKRSFATFDRGGQTGPPRSNDFFFGAADDTRAALTSGRTPGRTPADDTGASDDRPTSDDTGGAKDNLLRPVIRCF